MSIDGVKIPRYPIGDSAYPLKSWLMKPFTYGSSLTTQQKTYNYWICRARIVVENAYGWLKMVQADEEKWYVYWQYNHVGLQYA